MTELGGLEAILLAAGSGRRFGGGKLLAPWGDGVLLDGALDAAFSAPVRKVTVVTGAGAEQVSEVARTHARRIGREADLRLVHAPDHEDGMGASLRAGAASLPADTSGVFVFLGDMPRIPKSVLVPLSRALADGAKAAAPVFDGKRGHPALIGPDLLPDLLTLGGDAGARAVLQGLGSGLALVEAPDDGVLFDVDQPGDLIPRP